jgi:hypothetical protein
MSKESRAKEGRSRNIIIEAGHSHPDVDSIPIARMTPRQLHKYADLYNWDGGTGPLRRIIRHPKCDLGTAMLIFWRCDPRYYYECVKAGDTESISMNETRSLMREVIAKVRQGRFKMARIAFDPRKDDGYNWTTGKGSLKDLGMPEFMCGPVCPGRRDPRIKA